MITIGKSYTVFKPKEKNNNNGERMVSFSLGNSSYNKAIGAWENKGFVNVCAKTNQMIKDRDKIIISKITGLDTSEFNGKQSITIFVELEGEMSGNYEAIDSNDLPF